MTHAKADHARGVELLISIVLRVGVASSFVLVVAGLVITFVRSPATMRSLEPLERLRTPGVAAHHGLHDLLGGLAHLDGPAIVIAGLFVLIATPVLRVAASIAIFVYERDLAFVVITTVVLSLLVVAFVLGTTG